jgi:hypothetical protein
MGDKNFFHRISHGYVSMTHDGGDLCLPGSGTLFCEPGDEFSLSNASKVFGPGLFVLRVTL